MRCNRSRRAVPPRPPPRIATLVGASFAATVLSVTGCTSWLRGWKGRASPPRHHTPCTSLEVRELSLFHGAGDRLSELLAFHRLDEIVDDPLPKHRRGHVRIRKSGQYDHGHSGIVGPEVGDGFHAIDLWHPNIANQDVQQQPVLARVDGLDGPFTILGFEDIIAGFLE